MSHSLGPKYPELTAIIALQLFYLSSQILRRKGKTSISRFSIMQIRLLSYISKQKSLLQWYKAFLAWATVFVFKELAKNIQVKKNKKRKKNTIVHAIARGRQIEILNGLTANDREKHLFLLLTDKYIENKYHNTLVSESKRWSSMFMIVKNSTLLIPTHITSNFGKLF